MISQKRSDQFGAGLVSPLSDGPKVSSGSSRQNGVRGGGPGTAKPTRLVAADHGNSSPPCEGADSGGWSGTASHEVSTMVSPQLGAGLPTPLGAGLLTPPSARPQVSPTPLAAGLLTPPSARLQVSPRTPLGAGLLTPPSVRPQVSPTPLGAGLLTPPSVRPQVSPRSSTRQTVAGLPRRRRGPKPRSNRGGFTLIELLVVILIILLVSAVTLPVVIPAMSHRQVSEAARILRRPWPAPATRPLRTGAPSGIRLLPDPAFPLAYINTAGPTFGTIDPTQPLAANRIIPIEAAPEYSEGAVNISPAAGATFNIAYPPINGGGNYPVFNNSTAPPTSS